MNPALCKVFTYKPLPAFRRQASLNCWCPSFPMASVNCDFTLPICGIQFSSGSFSLVQCVCAFMYPLPWAFFFKASFSVVCQSNSDVSSLLCMSHLFLEVSKSSGAAGERGGKCPPTVAILSGNTCARVSN